MSPTVTENYPDEPPKFEERYRGVHVLQRDDNGMEKCVACFLCAAACPVQLHLHRGGGEHRHGAHLRRRALRQGLQHRLQPLHLLRLLRGGLPHRRHHPRPRFRGGQLQHLHAGQAQRGHARARCLPAPKPPVVRRPRRRVRRRTHPGARHVSRHPGTDRHHLPGRPGGQERGRDLPLLPRLPRHSGAPPGAPAVPLGRAAGAARDFADQPLLHGHRDSSRAPPSDGASSSITARAW